MQQPLKYPGGKYYLRKEIWRLAPPHTFRVIGCAGGLGEFWDWPDYDGVSEVINDKDDLLWNFYKVLQDERAFAEFRRIVEATPFGRRFWDEAGRIIKENFPSADKLPCPHLAAALFTRIRQSLMGLQKTFAPLSQSRTRRGMSEQASAWMTAVDGLPEAHARMRRVVVENLGIVELLKKYDKPNNFFLIDPPYYPGTREDGLYRVEMTAAQHERMLSQLLLSRANILICGYRCEAYDQALSYWNRVDVKLPNAMQTGKSKAARTESLWANYRLPNVESD